MAAGLSHGCGNEIGDGSLVIFALQLGVLVICYLVQLAVMTAPLDKSKWPPAEALVERNRRGEPWIAIGLSLDPPSGRQALMNHVIQEMHKAGVQVDDLHGSLRLRRIAQRADDSFIARMQAAIEAGHEKVSYGLAPPSVASGDNPRFVPLSVGMSYCSSPAGMCAESGDGERWNPRGR